MDLILLDNLIYNVDGFCIEETLPYILLIGH